MNSATSIRRRDAKLRSGKAKRWGALIGGGALTVFGLTRRSPAGYALAAAGGTLAYLGSKNGSAARNYEARASVLLNCTPEEAYNFWHKFEDLPLFMRHLDSVTQVGDKRYRWVAIGPMGVKVRWEAEVSNDRPNELIAWRSLPGSDLYLEGAVRFERAAGDRGTLVETRMRYSSPAGALGRAVTTILGKDPSFLAQQDLRRFKAFVETGEIPTTEGQPHGPRSSMTAAARLANPDRPIRRESRAREVLSAMRRIA